METTTNMEPTRVSSKINGTKVGLYTDGNNLYLKGTEITTCLGKYRSWISNLSAKHPEVAEAITKATLTGSTAPSNSFININKIMTLLSYTDITDKETNLISFIGDVIGSINATSSARTGTGTSMEMDDSQDIPEGFEMMAQGIIEGDITGVVYEAAYEAVADALDDFKKQLFAAGAGFALGLLLGKKTNS